MKRKRRIEVVCLLAGVALVSQGTSIAFLLCEGVPVAYFIVACVLGFLGAFMALLEALGLFRDS